MTEYTYGKDTRYPQIMLSERQWDVVREALYRRGTKQAAAIAEKIWRQGGRYIEVTRSLRLIDGDGAR